MNFDMKIYVKKDVTLSSWPQEKCPTLTPLLLPVTNLSSLGSDITFLYSSIYSDESTFNIYKSNYNKSYNGNKLIEGSHDVLALKNLVKFLGCDEGDHYI